MYTPDDRERLRAALIGAAQADPRITGAALTGSAAATAEDAWSDVDLAFGVSEAELDSTIADWTARMYADHGARHQVDVIVGPTTYRVFLLEDTLQVDLAFSPESEFGAINPTTFRLLFGVSTERTPVQPPAAEQLIGMGWLHALHARSSLERGRPWQAEYMISGVRDHALALACLRHGLPAVQGRGMDRLPAAVTAPMEAAVVRSLDDDELRRAFPAATAALLAEVEAVNPGLAKRLHGPLAEISGNASGSAPGNAAV